MIPVNRKKIPAPKVLSRPGEKGPLETKEVLAHFEEEGDPGPFGGFKAYGEPEVRWALEHLFHGKCAYCESRYAGTQPMDVEHWRPKGEVSDQGAEKHRGYYWLAADWENLLPSCIDCNRERQQRLEDGGPADGVRHARTAGKANQFPLTEESHRAYRPGELGGEQPLLLNPCDVDVDPADHLKFTADGLVRAKETDTGEGDGTEAPSPQAVASIVVYALNRSGLVQDRKEKALQIQHRLLAVEDLAHCLEQTDDKRQREFLEELLSQEIMSLASMCSARQPFAALARQLIEPFMDKLIGEPNASSGES